MVDYRNIYLLTYIDRSWQHAINVSLSCWNKDQRTIYGVGYKTLSDFALFCKYLYLLFYTYAWESKR
jgi:hypothetical protein